MSEEGTGLVYERHFTREEANALLPQLTELLGQLREAKDELTDIEAHEALCQAAPKNITRFKDVLEYLKQDLQHESPAK